MKNNILWDSVLIILCKEGDFRQIVNEYCQIDKELYILKQTHDRGQQ